MTVDPAAFTIISQGLASIAQEMGALHHAVRWHATQ